jgi:hypothetical protein
MPETSQAPDAPVEFRDFKTLHFNYFVICALFSVLGLASGDLFGVIAGGFLGTGALWSVGRLLSKRIRIAISRDGILEQNLWYSPGFIPWDQVLGFRERRMGSIEVEIRDHEEMIGQQPLLRRLQMKWLRFRGYGPVLIIPWGLEGGKTAVLEALQDGLDAYYLDKVRNEKAIGPRSSDPSRTEAPDTDDPE